MTDSTTGHPLRILYVWDSEYPWDVRTEKTCLALTQAGHEVHIVARNRNRGVVMEKLREATVHRMPPWSWAGQKLDAMLGFPAFFNPRWRSLIANTARMVKADLIIARDLPLCPTAISVGRELHIPVILDMAENYPAMLRALWQTGRQRPLDLLIRNPRFAELTETYCLRHVDHVLTVAQEMTERLSTMGVDRRRVTTVGNTPSLSDRVEIVATNEQKGDAIQLVYLGLMEVVRGISDLIDAVAFLHGTAPRVRLLLIGGGRDEGLFRARAEQRGLTIDDVVFAGHLPYRSALELMAQADIGVLPLHRNDHMDTTVPNKLFDYMSAGLPVITSDTIPSARIVQAENAGVVFKARNIESLTDAIVSLSDPALRREMGANGRAAVERSYNWEGDSAALAAAVANVRSRR